jgi:putative membrane protein
MCSLFGLLFLGSIIAIAAWASSGDFPVPRRRASAAFANVPRQRDSAEEILRGRLARGEIDTEEYERAMRVLKEYEV